MPKPTLPELRAALATATDPGQLLEMTAAQLAALAGPNPTKAAASALAHTADHPQTRLAVSAGALRPELLAAADHLEEPPPMPAIAHAPRTMAQPAPGPVPKDPATKTA